MAAPVIRAMDILLSLVAGSCKNDSIVADSYVAVSVESCIPELADTKTIVNVTVTMIYLAGLGIRLQISQKE